VQKPLFPGTKENRREEKASGEKESTS